MDFEDPPQYAETLPEMLNATHLRDDDGGAERLIVGLDFGTTYSGVAYAFTSKPDQIYTITEWPGAKGRTYLKCPTLIKYEGPNDFKWGFELDRATKGRIEGIKLLLDPDQPKPIYTPSIDSEAELKKLGKPPIDVASDYISAIFQHAMRKIESKYPRNYLDMLDKQYVLSVPAVWSDKAKNATLKAARNAGITPVKLIKEPEAAALFTLHEMSNKGLEVGDALVLCDAGGGTVDLISYEITKLNPLELKELTDCTGGLAGSLMINRRFEDWVKTVVGDRAYLDLVEQDSYRRAMKTFDENIKPGFRTVQDEEQYINFPKANLKDDPTKGLTNDTITVEAKTLHGIFEPIFREIDKLVKEQVNLVRIKRMKDHHPKGFDIKAIFLVGGFGSSAFLHENISNAHMDVQVIQPNDAWSAIVRGAVMSQLPTEAKVMSNVAPKHYGVCALNRYEESRDAGQEKHYSRHEEEYKTMCMTWYIEKGEDLLRSRKIEFPFYRTFDSSTPPFNELQVEEELMECTLDNSPVHPSAGSVTRNCTLKVDLSLVPQKEFKKRTRTSATGQMSTYYEMNYKLMVTIQSGPMIFSLVCGGKEYGQARADY